MIRPCASFTAILALAGFVLAACGEAPRESDDAVQEQGPAPVTEPDMTAAEEADYYYDCGGTEVGVTFDGTERMEMTVGEDSYSMLRVVSASGARFQAGGDESTVFWIQGDSASLTVGGEDYPECSTAD